MSSSSSSASSSTSSSSSSSASTSLSSSPLTLVTTPIKTLKKTTQIVHVCGRVEELSEILTKEATVYKPATTFANALIVDGAATGDKIKLIAFDGKAHKMKEQLHNGHVYKITHLIVKEAWSKDGSRQFGDTKVRPDIELQAMRKTTFLYMGDEGAYPQYPLPIPPPIRTLSEINNTVKNDRSSFYGIISKCFGKKLNKHICYKNPYLY